MSKRLTLPQLKRYEPTQKIIEALANAESRAILFAVVKEGKTAADMSDILKIPLSSVYKKIGELEALSLIYVEKWMISDSGKRYKVYRSRIQQAEITITKSEPVLTLIPN